MEREGICYLPSLLFYLHPDHDFSQKSAPGRAVLSRKPLPQFSQLRFDHFRRHHETTLLLLTLQPSQLSAQ